MGTPQIDKEIVMIIKYKELQLYKIEEATCLESGKVRLQSKCILNFYGVFRISSNYEHLL